MAHLSFVANSSLNSQCSLTSHSTTLMLDETKIRPKVVVELHVKRVEVSINCFREKSDAISSNSLVLHINLIKYVDIKITQAHASIIHAA